MRNWLSSRIFLLLLFISNWLSSQIEFWQWYICFRERPKKYRKVYIIEIYLSIFIKHVKTFWPNFKKEIDSTKRVQLYAQAISLAPPKIIVPDNLQNIRALATQNFSGVKEDLIIKAELQ